MQVIAGIDPGLSGGVALLGDNLAEGHPLPLTDKEIDGRELAEILTEFEVALVVVEKVGAMPKQGVSSTFKFGKGYGQIIGVLQALGLPFVLVAPQAWKRRILAGTAKDKTAAINYVANRYPSVNLKPGKKRTPHDGIADAVCLAEFGKGEL